MVNLTRAAKIFRMRFGDLRLMQAADKVIAFYRQGLMFAFNFHPSVSQTSVLVPVTKNADYTVEMCSDDEKYGGFGQVAHQVYPAKTVEGKEGYFIELYLPARTAVVLKEGKLNKPEPKAKKPAEKKAAEKKTESAVARTDA